MFYISKDYGDGTYGVTDSKDNVEERYALEALKHYKSRGIDIKGINLKIGKITVFKSSKSYWDAYLARLSLLHNVKLEFETDSNGVKLCNCTGDINRIRIPDFVTEIGYEAFRGCKCLESIEIPDSVKVIGKNAFSDCTELKSVSLPNSVTKIGEHAFTNCSNLKSISLPNSITSIDKGAFYGCTELKSVSLPNSITSISAATFGGCSNLKSVSLPNSITYIDGCAFNECTLLEDISLPESLEIIEYEAFRNTGLRTIKIPSSVREISVMAFACCFSLTSVEFSVSYADKDKTKLKGVEKIYVGAFAGCEALTSVTIPHTVSWIGNEAFSCCNLASLNFDLIEGFSHHLVLERKVFYNTALESVTLPTTLEVRYEAYEEGDEDDDYDEFEVSAKLGAEMSEEDRQSLQTQFPEGCKIEFKHFNG